VLDGRGTAVLRANRGRAAGLRKRHPRRGAEFQARVNGLDVADLDAYRTESPLLALTFAEDNIFGVQPGVAQSVSAAYSLIIAPPPPGQYEIATSATFGATTATVIVEAPQVIDQAATDSAWERIVPGGDCACADSSEFSFWVRRADPAKVVLYLEGGGACFDAVTCAFTDAESTTYDWNISALDDPGARRGIFDASPTENPFGDYTFVYVPYCTGDVHLGDATTEYSPQLTVQHKGWVNGTAALTYLAEHFADAAQVVVVGESAGAIAAPVYGGLVSDLLPEAQITVLADSSGAYPESPELNTRSNEVWGTFGTMPAWEVNAGLTAEDWGYQQFWVQAGLHDPAIVMSRFDYAYDAVQTQFMQLAGLDTSDVGATMLANEAAIEEAGVDQHSFTAPGTDHTVVGSDEFYETEVNGITVVEWVSDVMAGNDVADIACAECRGQ
jgi:Pectinacetylesterase